MGGDWARGGFLALGAGLGSWFVRMEQRTPAPLVDLSAILRPGVIVGDSQTGEIDRFDLDVARRCWL